MMSNPEYILTSHKDLFPEDIAGLLAAWGEGRRGALEEVVAVAYPQLRKLAHGFLQREAAGHTLQATGLVHELYLMLVRQRSTQFVNAGEFFGLAGYLMRIILRNHARDRSAQKRGGAVAHVPLNEDLAWVNADSEDVVDLDAALRDLEQLDPRKVRLVEMICYLGCSIKEAAELLGVSKATADRDLRFARAWLANRFLHGDLSKGYLGRRTGESAS